MQGRSKPHSNHISPGLHPNNPIHNDFVSLLSLFAGGAKYFVTFLDNYIARSDVYFLKSKDKTFPTFKNFKAQSKRGIHFIQKLKTDYGGEYEDYDFQDFRLDHSIQWEPIVPGTPQQNGAAECLGQTLMRKASFML